MRLVVFGLAVSSSWGNGHATLWRGLSRALARLGHTLVFFERDVPYYAQHRDAAGLDGGELVLYTRWGEIADRAGAALREADAAMVTSYCPDAIAATNLVLASSASVRVFYDLDAGVTLTRHAAGQPVAYLGSRGLRDFDLVLSYNGGPALTELQSRLGARRVAPLYGWVDPDIHYPTASRDAYRADLSYLGTFSPDRQTELEEFLVRPARQFPGRRFVIAGAQYPDTFPWTPNIYFVSHLPPVEHSAFYCSSRLTLNVTRRAMAAYGYGPSARLFEAAACGVPVVSDAWPGLDEFLEPAREVLIARTWEDIGAALELSDDELARIARAARARTLEQHTAGHRARELEAVLQAVERPCETAAELSS